ncbi:MAG: type II secretion system protein GspM [Stenotrophobium sp.]
MKQYLEKLREWFRSLAPRERIMVSVCAAVVAVTLLFVLVWDPLIRAHHQREQELASARAMSQRLEDMAAIVQRVHATDGGASAANRSLSLLAAVDQSSKSGTLSKPLTRLQPDGDKSVKIWVDDVAFDGLMRWIVELDRKYGVTVDSADIERADTVGLVNAKLTLVRP